MELNVTITCPELAKAILALAESLKAAPLATHVTVSSAADTAQPDPVSALTPAVLQPQPTPASVTTPVPTSTPAPNATAQSVPVATEVLSAASATVPSAVPTAVPPMTYALPDMQAACAPLMDAGRQNEIVALLQSFGVQALTQLPKERMGEFVTALRGLGARI